MHTWVITYRAPAAREGQPFIVLPHRPLIQSIWYIATDEDGTILRFTSMRRAIVWLEHGFPLTDEMTDVWIRLEL